MAMTERVARLRQASLDATPTLSAERARLLTDYYESEKELISEPLRRARAFYHLMSEKAVVLMDDELIVGERGPAPKATPTYPEVCCHTLEDLEILDSREKTPYRVGDDDRAVYENRIIPFWKRRSLRELIFSRMTDEWKACYEAGMFTEFMEQRAPGHTVLDDKIYRRGLLDFKKDIAEALSALNELADETALKRREQLEAMALCADGLIRFAERHAMRARELAAETGDAARKAELNKIADVCERVPARAPRDFHEALQAYWFVHLGVITELNTWDAFNPGHLDHHLAPFYKQGLADGTLTREQAEELLECFWIKFNNQPAPPKVGVTAAESGTYTDFAQINTGGLKPDGSDAVNEVTYLILDVIHQMRLLQPSSSVQLSKKNPDRFLKRAARIIHTGFGQPSIFNSDLIVQELVRQGKSVADARSGGSSGCVEVGAFGKENYTLTGYMNLPKILDITLHNGLDPRSGKRLGLETGDPASFGSFEQLMEAFRRQVRHFVDIKVRGNNVIERIYARYLPAPFLSLIINDCIEKGMDYHEGGARYNTSYIQGVGLGSLTDAMTAIRFHCFDERTFTLAELVEVLDTDFRGHEKMLKILLNRTPKYGNDDEYADGILRRVFDAYFDAVDGRPNTRGGRYHINLLPTTCHVYFGSVIGATADGRRAGQPLSEGVSPVQGADRKGPTAVIRSVSKMDHARTGGTLLNQKLTPHLLEGDEGVEKFVNLVRSYFRMDGHHIQFNVVDADTLREAQDDPIKHRNLIVRVAGYSDYFCDLSKALQDEIIARTEHQDF